MEKTHKENITQSKLNHMKLKGIMLLPCKVESRKFLATKRNIIAS